MGFSLGKALGGGLLGGVTGGMLGGFSDKIGGLFGTQTKEVGSLPKWLLPQFQGAATDARSLYQNAQFTPASGATMQGAQELIDFNPAGAQDALGLAQRTMAGDYLSPDSNPWLKQTFDSGANAIQARLGSQFGGAGRFNSGAMAGATGQSLTDLAGNIYGGNYQQERNRQMQAMGMAPMLDQGVLAGTRAQLMGGGLLDDEAQREANFGWDNLDRYTGQLTRLAAPSQVQQVSRNPLTGILGGAMGGYAMTGSPWGAAAGGLLGGLG